MTRENRVKLLYFQIFIIVLLIWYVQVKYDDNNPLSS